MPTNTSKFNLVKPLKSEKYNVDVFNGNADIIDSQIYSKTEVDTALNDKAPLVHTHPISEVVNLQTALNGKADTTTTINNQPLSSNIIINASDVPNTPAGNISATTVQNALNELDAEKANRTQEAWITPTLLNGATGTIQYRINQFGRVEFKGSITSYTTFTNIILLPVGYRPLASFSFILYSEGGGTSSVRGFISVAGVLQFITANATSVSMMLLTFATD